MSARNRRDENGRSTPDGKPDPRTLSDWLVPEPLSAAVASRPPAFRLDQISKRCGSTPLLRNLSWEGPAGSVIALLGPNGAGKTTLLRILLGLEAPTSGRSEVLGFDSQTQGREVRRRVGYVAEHPPLYDWMSVTELGWFTAGFYPPGYEEEFLRLVGEFRVAPERRVTDLSRGEKAKLALAVAMAHQPELLVLDEPLAGLDPLVRREFLEAVADIATSGRTVLLSTHDLPEVERVADVVAVLNRGRLVAAGSLDQLKQRVCEVTIAWTAAADVPPVLGGPLLYSQRWGRQCRLFICDLEAGRLKALRGDPRVRQVTVRRPGLEELFAALLKCEQTGGDDAVERSYGTPLTEASYS